MRPVASLLHLDLDAFFAAVEQRDKPSLRGKPVIVGGLGQRGVVATASYEARVFGVHSAMPMHEARRRCPHAAFISGRFGAYRKASAIVMNLLRELSPLVEPLSLDEAFVDLAPAVARRASPSAAEQHPAVGLTSAVAPTPAVELVETPGPAAAVAASPAVELVETPGTTAPGEPVATPGPTSAVAPTSAVGQHPAVELVETPGGTPPPLVLRSFDPADLLALAEELRARLTELTGGLTASVGIGSSKFIAKVASELAKPNGVRIVQPGTEVATIAPLPARSIPGVGPVTMERLSRLGVRTIGDLQGMSRGELVRELGKAAGEGIAELAFARDDRSVEAERETKSISVEDTFEHDLRDRAEIDKIIERDAADVARRLAKAQLFARTITLKARHPDFTTFTRSRTLNGATDRAELIAGVAKGMLHGLDLAPGLRLLGVGVAGFTQIAQEALFDLELDAGPVTDETHTAPAALSVVARREAPRTWVPGMDVQHALHGPGWVWGAGLGRVTVRFETAETGPGPVRTLAEDDPDLSPRDP